MKTALLVIDVQHGLFAPNPQPFDATEVVARINALTDWARAIELPVVFIQHEEPGDELGYLSEGWQLQHDLEVKPSDLLVRKTTPDSFLRTELFEHLDKRGIEHVIVCGYATEFCVDTTTRRAAGLGYAVTLAADAHTTHDKAHASGEQIRRHHNATLPSIGSFGVKIQALSSESIIASPVA